jgi:hypothetical protein
VGRRAARLDGARKETAAKLDAEEWRELVGAYLDAASAAVTDMGGHVAKKLGDWRPQRTGARSMKRGNVAYRVSRPIIAANRELVGGSGDDRKPHRGSAPLSPGTIVRVVRIWNCRRTEIICKRRQ